MSIHSDMEILSDMLNGEESPYGDIIEVDQELSYYNGFGIELTKQIKTTDQYFNLLMGVIIKYKELNDEQKKLIQTKMEIFPQTIYKERVIFKESGNTKKKLRPKLNIMDDY